MVEENKIRVYAPIEVQEEVEKAAIEKASFLAFPDEKQQDLQYMRSVLVSAGTNKNGAHFLPSEMMKAHNTVVHKAIDIEHEEERVIGHIYDCAYLYKDGTTFDPLKVMADYEETARDLDEVDMDIAVAGVIHKMRFPEYAEEISGGEWKVSMECFFKDFDIKIGDTIITRDEASALGYSADDLIGGFVKVVAGHKEMGVRQVARVLRHITFSGMGIVKNPANPHSIIMETAAHRELMEKGEQVVDLEAIDNLRGNNKIVLSEKAGETQVDKEDEVADNLVEISTASADEETPKLFVELDEETGGISRVLTVSPNKEVAARWSGGGLPGPGRVGSNLDGTCVSFKKRLTKFNALDQSEGAVVEEHYCALFEERCPVIGATAKAPECLRNQRNSVTKNPEETTITKTVREHVNDAPGNSFTTTLITPYVNSDEKASTEPLAARAEQISRLREEAQSLRNSLREFEIDTEKKNS
jgi:hypothetical protein